MTSALSIFFPISIYIFLIRPGVLEIYRDPRIFHSRRKQVLLYISTITLVLLAIGVIEQIFGVMPPR